MASNYTSQTLPYLDTRPQSGKSIPAGEKANAVYIANYLKSQGYTKAGAQAVLANVNRESSFNPAILERGVGGSSEIGGKGGYGLIQWTGQKTADGRLRRRGKLEKAANFNVATRDSLDFQTRYLVSEVAGKAIANTLKTEQDPVAATLDLLFLDIRPGSAIRVKEAVKNGKTPSADDIKRVQRRIDAIWEVQSVVDEVYGGSIQDYSTGQAPTNQAAGGTTAGTGGTTGTNSTNPDSVNAQSNSTQASGTIPATDQEPVYTKDSFVKATAQHFKKMLSGFVAFRLENVEEKDTGVLDNDDLNEFWIPLFVVLDVYNQYVSLLDATSEPQKGSNTPGRKLTQFYTGYQDTDTSKQKYEKKCKFLTNELHFSIDPMVCILPKPLANITLTDSKGQPVPWDDGVTSYAPGLVYKNGFHRNVMGALERGVMRGETDDILNILISCQFLQEELDKIVQSSKDSDQNEGNDMVSFMRTVLTACTEALGGINDLDLFYDEKDDLFYIVDRKVTPALRNIIPTISLTGIRSTISKLSIESKISSNIGNMISVAAQGTGGHTKDNIAPLLEWNRGLLDRHIVHKSQKNDDNGQQIEKRESPEDERLKKWTEAYFTFWEEFNGNAGFWPDDGDYDRKAIANIKGYHKEFCQKWVVEKRSKDANDPIPAPGVIPVELSFTMMGIGGLKIGQAFLVEEGILPQQYSDNFGFIITGLSHNISDGKWTTDIKTQFYCTRKPTAAEIAYFTEKYGFKTEPYRQINSGSPTSGGSAGSVVSAGNPADITGQTITSGFPFGPWFNNKVYKKTQVVIHWSAGNQLARKGKGTIDTLNKRNLSYHYIIDAAGHVENVVPEHVRAWHAGNANSNSIGISIQNLGYCKDENNSSYGKIPDGQLKCARVLDHNGNPTTYRNIKWNQEVTDAQITALENLLKGIKQRNPNIPSYSWKGKETYDQFFPPNDSSGKRALSYSSGKPGYYSHCSITTGKTDMMPTPKILNLLKRLKL